MLSEQYDITIEKCSNIYETEPQNLKDQPYFLNCVIKIKTSILPLKLLETCQQVESAIGRNQASDGHLPGIYVHPYLSLR